MSASTKNGRNSKILLASAVAGALVGMFAPSGAPAASDTWKGGGADSNWQTTGNWDTLPAAGDILQFDGTTNLTTNNDFAANTSFGGLTFLPGAGSFTLGGNPILLSGDINDNSTNAQTINFTPVDTTIATVDGHHDLTYTTGGLVLDGSTSNVNVISGGSLSLGQVTFGLVPQSANVSTLNINNSVSASGLTVQTNSADSNVINIATGQTFTVGGNVYFGTAVSASGQGDIPTNVNFTGGGNFSVTDGDLYVGLGNNNVGSNDHNTAIVDMTGLANFSYTGGGNFGVGWMTRPRGELHLASGSNVIIASSLRVGESGTTGTNGSSDNNNGSGATLFLGSGTNFLNTDELLVGNTKGNGTIDWQDPTSGSVTIAGQDGISRTDITVAHYSSGSATSHSSQIFLAGHTANVLADTVQVGVLEANGSGDANLITFDSGVFDTNNLDIAVNIDGSSGTGAVGEFRLGGDSPNSTATGVLNVNSEFLLGNDTNSDNPGAPTVATFTINGGTANINTDIQVVSNGDTSIDNSTLTLANGTLNMLGHNIGSYASPVKLVDLSGGALNNAGAIAGNTINVGSGLTVTGTPTYVLPGGGTLTAASGLTFNGQGGIEGGSVGSPATISGDVAAENGAHITAGTPSSLGSLQFQNNLSLGDGAVLNLKLSDSGTDLINVGGNLSLSGSIALNLATLGTGPAVGNTYTLINYAGTLTGSESNLVLNNGGTRATFTLVPTSMTPNAIQVSVGGSAPLATTWIGDVSNSWSVNGDANFQDASLASQQFFNLDQVTFDDTSTNTNPVELSGQLNPGGLTVNASRDYTFSGSGGIAGGIGIAKAGSGTLVLATENTYSGTTDIQSGTVQVGDGGITGSLGSGPVSNAGVLAFNRADNITVANVISGSGAVNHIGSGITTLSAENTYTGDTNISAGTVVVTNSHSLGDTGGGTVNITSGGQLDLTGVTTANALDFDAKQFNIAGSGPDGAGAIVYNGGPTDQTHAFNSIALTDDATVGGTGRFDIRGAADSQDTLNLNGHTLTVAGNGADAQLSLVYTDVSDGNIVVNGGTLSIETTSNVPAGSGSITYNAGTIGQFYRPTADISRAMFVNGATLTDANQPNAVTIASPLTFGGDNTIQINGSSGFTFSGGISETIPSSLTKTGGGTLILSGASNVFTGGLNVAAGTMQLAASSGVNVIKTGAVSITPGTSEAPIRLDLTDGKLISTAVDAAGTWDSGSNQYTGISGLVQSGRNGGSWDGNTGIISSTAASDANPKLFSIGVVKVADLKGGSFGDTDTATFAGQTVQGSDTIAMYTYGGDANLDGKINIDDYGLIDSHVGQSGTVFGWHNGDFNYDGKINIDDYGIIDGNIGAQGDPIPTSAQVALLAGAGAASLGGVSAVPEPASLGLIALAGVGLLRRRRRHGIGSPWSMN